MRKLADTIHKTAVTCLMGLTLLGAITFSSQVFQYIAVKRPSRKALAEKKDEEDLTEKVFPENLSYSQKKCQVLFIEKLEHFLTFLILKPFHKSILLLQKKEHGML
ncbi:hypothetical protein TNCT_54661 [Trichonephila clavata]|uniref:Uncharacterized protein n=1 Tax=Trichonephila clavata TaxID=2740835 RepID=A0A8X6GFQ9_TRICU|nr:hypothetical protein TNCT_54661 [Trichonephila clavata]